MTPVANTIEQTKNKTADTVRIDSPDVGYCETLRQFLQQRGCIVNINPEHTENVTYSLVVGNSEFVKAIVDKQKKNYEKRLIICWAGEPDLTPVNATKLVLIDEITLTQNLILEIMKFFITSKRHLLNLRTEQTTVKKTLPIPENAKQREEIPPSNDVLRISQTISNLFPTLPKKEKIKKVTHFPKINNLQKINYFLFLLISLIIIPFIFYEGSIGATGFYLNQAYGCAKKSNLSCATVSSKSALNALTSAQSLLSLVSPPAVFVGLNNQVRSQEKILTFLFLTHDLVNDAIELTRIGKDAGVTVLQPNSSIASPSLLVLTEQIKSQLFSMQTTVNLLWAMLNEESITHTFPLSIPPVKQKLMSLKNMLARSKEMLDAIDRFTVLYPRLGGFRDKQTYLILLQNSSELRPTGGFIGSFMRLTVSDGAVKETKIEDIYTIDGQLKGHVDPPEPLKTLMGTEHWYLRDSNWSPDFRESAQKALWFYEKETGEKPDGVIAITTQTISRLLSLTGPVDIQDLNDRITADNFFAKSLAYTQGDFFPGSTQKKDFLTSFYTGLLDKITHTPTLSVYQMLELIYENLATRDIQLYSDKPETQTVLEEYGWAGKVPARQVFDFTYLNEASVSVSKVNYFIKHADSQEITIDPNGGITKTIARTITNTSNGELGTGVYRTYLRLLIPNQAQLTELTIDGVPIPAKNLKKKIPDLPYAEMDEPMGSLQVIGIALDVPVGETRTVRIIYTQSGQLANDASNLTYEFYNQKQAGIGDTPLFVTIKFPATWQVTGEKSTFVKPLANPGILEYNSTVSGDTNIIVNFKKSL